MKIAWKNKSHIEIIVNNNNNNIWGMSNMS